MISIVLSIAGCSASGEKFQELEMRNDSALVYIYRPWQFTNGGGWPHVYVDGEKIGPLKNGGYIAKDITPGNHSIELRGDVFNFPNLVLELDAEDGQTYYARMLSSVTDAALIGSISYVSKGSSFHLVESSHAKTEIVELKYSQ